MSTIRGLVKHVDRRLFQGLFRDLEHYRARRGPYLRAPSNSYVVYPFLPVGRSRERFRQLCDKYGSDKSSMREGLSLPYSWVAHRYDFLYAALFPTEQNRKDVRFVFEVGLGSTDPEIASNMGPGGVPGASMRIWQDFFPRACVVGADVDAKVIFETPRIKTYLVDQTKSDSVSDMWKAVQIDSWGQTLADVGGFDLIVDDGLHTFEANCTFLRSSLGQLTKSRPAYYVVEDVSEGALPDWYELLNDVYVRDGFSCFVYRLSPESKEATNDNCIVLRAG